MWFSRDFHLHFQKWLVVWGTRRETVWSETRNICSLKTRHLELPHALAFEKWRNTLLQGYLWKCNNMASWYQRRYFTLMGGTDDFDRSCQSVGLPKDRSYYLRRQESIILFQGDHSTVTESCIRTKNNLCYIWAGVWSMLLEKVEAEENSHF